MCIVLLLIAVACLALSGAPAVLLRGMPRSAGWAAAGATLSTGLNLAASLLGFAAMTLYTPGSASFSAAWMLPIGRVSVALDPLSILFLIPIFLVSALGSIYSLSYWPARRHAGTSPRLRACWGLLAGAMAMVVLSRDSILFLISWEMMALAAFLLVATEDHKREARAAAWVYLVATHIGTLCLVGFFALLGTATRSTALWPVHAAALPLGALFVLGAIGFGMKAGLFPLHVWLPGAHANAPSHVSAILSGVMLKMGVYGLFRVAGLVDTPPAWWGAALLAAGALSALLGIAYAGNQKDYKRLMAYSSIENVGIIVMGLGLGLLGRGAGRPDWVVLGIGASLLHVLNHSLFKPLLFFGAGNLLHAVRTRRMETLGGLARRMPATFLLFLVGAIAICGLPPLNGFVSELLLYLGLFKTVQTPGTTGWAWASVAAPALAAVGAMAVLAFVRLLGSVFLGEPRGHAGDHAHEAPGMIGPMVLLAGLCVSVGLYPMMLTRLLDAGIADWAGAAQVPIASLVPLEKPVWIGLALLGMAGTAVLLLALLMRHRSTGRAGTWDCGYLAPTARMEYTGASFAQMLLDLGAWALWPAPGKLRVGELFSQERPRFARTVPDAVLERLLWPFFLAARTAILFVRGLQQGSVQAYLVYVLVVIVVLLLA